MSQQAVDRAYLESLIDGSGDLLAEDTMEKLEPLFARYEADPVMNALLERAVKAYGNEAVAAATWVLAGIFIEQAHQRASALLTRATNPHAKSFVAAWIKAILVIEKAQSRAPDV